MKITYNGVEIDVKLLTIEGYVDPNMDHHNILLQPVSTLKPEKLNTIWSDGKQWMKVILTLEETKGPDDPDDFTMECNP